MSDIFKVRVVKAGETDWYSDKIGQECSVIISDTDYYYTDGDGFYNSNGCILKSDCVIVEDFKVGRRVEVKPECVGKHHRDVDEDGGAGTLSYDEDYPFVDVKLDNGGEWSYEARELTLLEDTMEYTKDGVTYRQLKDITPEAIYDTKPCAEEWSEFYNVFARNYGWSEPIKFRVLVSYCVDSKPVWIQWLVDHGFVVVVEEALDINMKTCDSGVTFDIDDIWAIDASCILTNGGTMRVRLNQFGYRKEGDKLIITRK